MKGPTAHDLRKAADRLLARCFERHRPPQVKQLAAMFHMGRGNFSDYFLRLIGERPSEYLKRGQIERAKRLLKTTDLSIEDIAELCCFRSTVTFFRMFKRLTGLTPKQFRMAT